MTPYADSVGNDRQDDYYAYNYTQIVKDFTTVDAAGVQQLTGAIEALEPAGATSVDYGLTLAQDVLDGQWRHDGGEWWVGSDADRRPAGRQAGRGGLYRW